jgi:GDP-L-fucose synthase
VSSFFQDERPDYVILAPPSSNGNGGAPADVMYQRCVGQNTIIYASWKFQVRKLVYLATSCVYPAGVSTPAQEDEVFSGAVVMENRSEAVANLAGLTMCAAFRRQYGFDALGVISSMIYGPQQWSELDSMSLIGRLLKKNHDALHQKEMNVVVEGNTDERHEVLHRDDLVEAVMTLLKTTVDVDWVNVGSGEFVSLRELVEVIAQVTGVEGMVLEGSSCGRSFEDRCLDSSRIRRMGWAPRVALHDGIQQCWDLLQEDIQ